MSLYTRHFIQVGHPAQPGPAPITCNVGRQEEKKKKKKRATRNIQVKISGKTLLSTCMAEIPTNSSKVQDLILLTASVKGKINKTKFKFSLHNVST